MGESEDEFRKVLDESIKINKCAINLEKLNKSLDKLRNSGFNDLEICRLKGFVYLELMDYKNSFDEYKKALSLLEKGRDFDDISIHKQKTLIGGDGASDIKYIEKSKYILKAWIHHGFAVVSTVMKKYSDAEKHFGIAKGLFWDAGDDGLAARVLNDMGWLYDEQKDYDKALHQYEEAIRNSSNSLTLAYSNLYRGTALYNCDNRDKRAYEAFKEANRHLKDARTLKESKIYSNKILECDLLEAKISTNMARLILKSGTELNIDIDDGKKLLDSALELYNNNLEHIDAIFSNRLNMVEKDNLAVIHNLLGKYYFIKDDKTLAEEEFSNAKKYSNLNSGF